MDVDITLYKEDEIINEHKNLKALYNKFENSYSFNLDVLTKIIIEEEK